MTVLLGEYMPTLPHGAWSMEHGGGIRSPEAEARPIFCCLLLSCPILSCPVLSCLNRRVTCDKECLLVAELVGAVDIVGALLIWSLGSYQLPTYVLTKVGLP